MRKSQAATTVISDDIWTHSQLSGISNLKPDKKCALFISLGDDEHVSDLFLEVPPQAIEKDTSIPVSTIGLVFERYKT